MSDEKIYQRILGRKEAEALLELRELHHSNEHNEAFALEMRRFSDSVLGGQVTSLRVMDKNEASKFERETIKFGIHLNEQFRNVPIEYLAWVADQSNNLSAYLRSNLGQRRLRTLDAKP